MPFRTTSCYLDEAQVEIVTVDYFRELGYEYVLGPAIAPGSEPLEHADYGHVLVFEAAESGDGADQPGDTDVVIEDVIPQVRRLDGPDHPLPVVAGLMLSELSEEGNRPRGQGRQENGFPPSSLLELLASWRFNPEPTHCSRFGNIRPFSNWQCAWSFEAVT